MLRRLADRQESLRHSGSEEGKSGKQLVICEPSLGAWQLGGDLHSEVE